MSRISRHSPDIASIHRASDMRSGAQVGVFAVNVPRQPKSDVAILFRNKWGGLVQTCDECERFIGYPASAPPHSALRGFDARMKPNGVVELFKCTVCGSRW